MLLQGGVFEEHRQSTPSTLPEGAGPLCVREAPLFCMVFPCYVYVKFSSLYHNGLVIIY